MEAIRSKTKKSEKTDEVYTGFLKEEIVLIQFIPKPTKDITDPKHVAYGGKLNGTFDYISPPRLRKDVMKNILTNEEKEGLEHIMKVDLSVYGDFWKGYKKDGGLFPIALGKDDVTLNLSIAEDYIVYKVLLNTNLVANSPEQLKDQPRASYKYVMVRENEAGKVEEERINDKTQAYVFFNEISGSRDALRYLLRLCGKHTHSGQKMAFLRKEVGKLIEEPKYVKVILDVKEDKLFKEKILLEEAVTLGVIDRISGQYFTKENEPISGTGEEPNEWNSARFLGSPVGQDMRLAIEARIKNARE